MIWPVSELFERISLTIIRLESFSRIYFSICIRFLAPTPLLPINPCVPSPCGPFSQCQDIGGISSCSCLPNYVGSAPNCRPECSINSDCTSNKACVREKCKDPCPGSCATNALCSVINHTPVCTCPRDYTGDPFTNCQPILTPTRKNFWYNLLIIEF